jgi:phosphoribosylformimino-5-aminoimidazole carboxamide ribotide isomerase
MLAKSAAIARRIARPSAAQDGGKGTPANPPPVTHSWTSSVQDRPEVITLMPFRIVPVLDLKEGRVVHAVGGRRDQYRPLRSVWQASSEPIPLASALLYELKLDTLYLADLDAIQGRPPEINLYRQLMDLGLEVWIDAGLRDPVSAEPLMDLNPQFLRIVVGLETVRGPRQLAGIVERVGIARAIFSLDLFEGRPLGGMAPDWETEDPQAIAHRVFAEGVEHLIILDLARVGTGRGAGTESLMTKIHAAHPAIAISVGGGISGMEDVLHLKQAGASAVLVGSAIHDGRIGRRELEPIARASRRC